MPKRIALAVLFPILCVLSALPAFGNPWNEESSLVFRFTGPEAQRLIQFMKERTHRDTDFDQTRYYGERMSLACRDRDDCYLWLARKEWTWRQDDANAAAVLTFTLPLKQTTWSGTLSVSTGTSNAVQLQLQDLYYPGTFTFLKPLNCPLVKGTAQPTPLSSNGDCLLELSTAPKKGLPYPVSEPYFENLGNVAVNFKGPWAKRLFAEGGSSSVDPYDPKRLRVQLGTDFYCWNLDPQDKDRYLDDPYVCQAKLVRKDKALAFHSSPATWQRGQEFSLSFTPAFRQGILEDSELTLHSGGQAWTVTHCPNYGKNAGYGKCSPYYDVKIDVDFYPIGDSVQGVAVGWGRTLEAP